MNINDIALRIENPATLLPSDIPVLQELSKKYPYAQLFSLLYLKALAKDQSLELEDALTKHAYKITDRVRLYEVLNEQEEENTIVKELYENTTDTPIISEKTIEETPIFTEDNSNDGGNKIEDNLTKDFEKELDLAIISNAISGVFEHEFEPEKSKNYSEIPPSTSFDETTNSKKIEDKELALKGSKQSFNTWLKAGTKNANTNKTENSTEKIIDTFIQEDPKISQPKKAFYSPIKQAKKSLDSENLQYTETLANILSVQGNYPKAILAYEQLCLTIPEKKTFFVQKIKELKEKLNS